MKPAMATMLHVVCSPASRSSSRVIITYPRPWRIAASGSIVGSAPPANHRTARWASRSRPSSTPRNGTMRAGMTAYSPSDASV